MARFTKPIPAFSKGWWQQWHGRAQRGAGVKRMTAAARQGKAWRVTTAGLVSAVDVVEVPVDSVQCEAWAAWYAAHMFMCMPRPASAAVFVPASRPPEGAPV